MLAKILASKIEIFIESMAALFSSPAPCAVESIGGLFTQVPRRRPTAPVTDPRTLEDDADVQYNTALRIHNEKDVSIGLLELCITLHGGQEKLMELRPDASTRQHTI